MARGTKKTSHKKTKRKAKNASNKSARKAAEKKRVASRENREQQRPSFDGPHPWLRVIGAAQNNLRRIDVGIPLQRFVCVTGVSGSGKSSLVNDIIRETLSRDLNGAVKADPGKHEKILGAEYLDKVIDIDQSPIGRTPRSNPATYIKVFDLIRDLFAKLPDAKVRGYKPGRFSFNVPTGRKGGGRCEACEGNGSNRMEMDFLADVWVTCPVCGGKRFARETLQILYRGKTITDVLNMDVQEALTHFENQPKIANMLQTLHDVGLDYVKLGQSSTTLSGGEAQRIKLARELVKRSTGRTLYLLDEPTTGLHFDDIKKLLAVLHGFVNTGNSVVVIEHNLDVIKTADWVVDLGPEGGSGGGRVIAEGTPEKIATSKQSHTGVAIAELFERHEKAPAVESQLLALNRKKIASKNEPGVVPKDNSPAASTLTGGNGDALKSTKGAITVVGARQHNLKNLTAQVPRGGMTVCAGPSGSGKSSFAIDTVYTEGQRRYVESLSSYARQFIGQLQPPKVDHVYGLSPSICIEQKNASKSPRSTVGTVTEIYDHMRVLWARLGQAYCPVCKIPIGAQSSDEIVEKVLSLGEGTRTLLLAPVQRTGGESYEQLFARERTNGYSRVRVNEKLYGLEDKIPIDTRRHQRVELVVDRIIIRQAAASRITDSVEQALSVGDGVMLVQVVDENGDAVEDVSRFSQHFSCDRCGRSFDEITPHHFSFNARMGWCDSCEGLGTQKGATPTAIAIHPTRSILDGAIAGIGKVKADSKLAVILTALADHIGFEVGRPWNNLTESQRIAFLHGTGENWIEAKMPNRGTKTLRENQLSGVRFRWRGFYPAIGRATRVSWHYRKTLEDLVTEVPCDACGGSRLKPEPAAVRLNGSTIHEACLWSLGDTLKWFENIKLDTRGKRIAGELLHEITSRLRFLVDVGLDYVSLHRTASTLSGGESQRIQLASQIGTGLTGVLYVLDEPTIGLHPRDNKRLIGALNKLKKLGNTLLLVEHDREVIDAADRVMDFGPGAGRFGGEVTAEATPKQLRRKSRSLTGKYLTAKESIPVPSNRRPIANVKHWLTVHGAREHNLKEIDVEFPLSRFTCVTGVSGSGKSSLVSEVLYPALASRIHRASLVPGGHDHITGIEHIDKVINVDQSPIGSTPTSNPATFTGVFDEIRNLYAKLPDSKVRGYTPGRFSFNRAGGRCEACEGMGQRLIEMHFLPDVWIECEECEGARYVPETLEVRFKGKNIAEVLEMSVSEALELFAGVPKIKRMLQTLEEVGLGYLGLGQSAPTLSGGEAQRVKLAAELGRPQTGKTMYILDEPTTGLHFDDLKKLLIVLHRLVDLGNTVICIEHNLDVIKTTDYMIDLGPEAANEGGEIVACGTPEEIIRTKASRTGVSLKPVIKRGPVQERPVFTAEEQAKREAAARKRIDLGDDVRMPWEVNGKRWHTETRTDRCGKPIEWDTGVLTWLVEEIQKHDGFKPTKWSDRAHVEIAGPGKGTWFAHFLTGSRHQLDVMIRIPKGTFTQSKLNRELNVKTLDERTDLPIYGPDERVALRPRYPQWDEVRMWLRDFVDVDRRKFRKFLKQATSAYLSRLEEEQGDKKKSEPWKAEGRAWHLSQKSMHLHDPAVWEPSTLIALIGLFKKLQPDIKVDWNKKVLIALSVPGEKKIACTIVTNRPQGLRIELTSPISLCTPAEIDRLGIDAEVRPAAKYGYDGLNFWIRSLDENDPKQLAAVWQKIRKHYINNRRAAS